MKSFLSLFSCVLVFLFLIGCASQKTVLAPEVYTEHILLDTLEVIASPITDENRYEGPKYNASEKRTFDLIHTKLDLSFDWEKQDVIGKAWLTITPLFYPQQIVILDAQHFDILAVKDELSQRDLNFKYDDQKKLHIDLGRELTRGREVVVYIQYVAHPDHQSQQQGGAITSDQGLFFIDPLENDPDLPTQIWTQGETQNNSRWFPTFDIPNERSTQETILTVRESFKTLSNGAFVSSKSNGDGTRTDHWKMSKPHAPYLFMIAVGDFAKVSEMWRDIPVSYWVEPEYEASAKTIFNHTTEMLTFFSEVLGVDYPWEKFDQIVVREFVSGAMENTTAVIFGDFVQNHSSAFLTGAENDYIVAHEMIHHWFGDMVTCESWANLTLNEGFANYGEYLWNEHKYGKEEADLNKMNEVGGYMREASGGAHPLIHYYYDDKENMFDAHSYNKGGLVLHMLRDYLGDEAFFASMQKYLKENAYQSVEVHDLRQACESISGEDLHWFFDQWYESAGHPVLEVQTEYLAELGKMVVSIEQKQDPEDSPAVFQFPIAFDFHLENGSIERRSFWVNKRQQLFDFETTSEPLLVVPDANDVLLSVLKYETPETAMMLQLKSAKSLRARTEALSSFTTEENNQTLIDVWKAGLQDSHWSIRQDVVQNLSEESALQFQNELVTLARQDPDIRVRLAAVQIGAAAGIPGLAEVIESHIKADMKDAVLYTSLNAMSQLDPARAESLMIKFNRPDSEAFIAAKAAVLAAGGKSESVGYFSTHLDKVGQYFNPFIDSYMEYLTRSSESILEEGMTSVKSFFKADGHPYFRYLSLQSMNEFAKKLVEAEDSPISKNKRQEYSAQLQKDLRVMVSGEKNPRWKEIFEQALGPDQRDE